MGMLFAKTFGVIDMMNLSSKIAAKLTKSIGSS